MFDPYKVLEVNPRASSAVIKAAYHAPMKKAHPDPMVDFIYRITKKNILDRPQADLFDDFVRVRHDSFGRARSGMKTITGLTQ
jgi:DnaJ-class molecular chaperone